MADPTSPTPRIELWGGLECSVVRIGDSYRDQFAETGHWDRSGDFEAVAELGIRTLRYPVLWEHVAPERPDHSDFTRQDERMAELRRLGIEPVVGLIHHGSGPRYTSLLDPGFAEGLAAHAREVARRYPWVTMFTPVNEPLTTARFSGLYGHWYPHARDERSFLRMLVNQCLAVALSMAAIREVIPGARLVQTEDLGKVFATEHMQYQADYENERRWLSFDLLCGKVDRSHPFYRPLRRAGVTDAELGAFSERPCIPDIIGINHYLTSERFLDHKWWAYRPEFQGSNGRDRYADAEAVRILHLADLGPLPRLREAWERYRLPLAVTEAHHFCTADEQVRWLLEVWEAANTIAEEGADIRAVTVWSMFGALDWNSLLTERNGVYEHGPFDVRENPPRRTLLALAAQELALNGGHEGRDAVPLGWWKRPERAYEPVRGRRAG